MSIDSSMNRDFEPGDYIVYTSLWFQGAQDNEKPTGVPLVAYNQLQVIKKFNMMDEFTTFNSQRKLMQTVAKGQDYEQDDEDEAFYNWLVQQKLVKSVVTLGQVHMVHVVGNEGKTLEISLDHI